MIALFLLIAFTDGTTTPASHGMDIKSKGILRRSIRFLNKKKKLFSSSHLPEIFNLFKSKIIHPKNEKKDAGGLKTEVKDIYNYVPANIIKKEEYARRFYEPIKFSNRKLPEIPREDADEVTYLNIEGNPVYENVDSFCSNENYEKTWCCCPEKCPMHIDFKSKENKVCWYYKYTNGLIKKPSCNINEDINKTFDGYCVLKVTEKKVNTLYKNFCFRLDFLRTMYRFDMRSLIKYEGKNYSSEIKHDFLLKTLTELNKKALDIYNGYKYHNDGTYAAIMLDDILNQLEDMEKWNTEGCKCTPKCEITKL
jgi:hypothetical protein